MSAARPNRHPGPVTTCLSCRMSRHQECSGQHCRCTETTNHHEETPDA